MTDDNVVLIDGSSANFLSIGQNEDFAEIITTKAPVRMVYALTSETSHVTHSTLSLSADLPSCIV